MADVVVRLERRLALALVRQDIGGEETPGLEREARAAISAALDSPPVEERVEYEVTGVEQPGRPFDRVGHLWHDEARAIEDRDGLARGGYYRDLRIRTRTVLTSPWTDLPSEEGER